MMVEAVAEKFLTLILLCESKMKLTEIKSLDRDGLGAFPARFSALEQPAIENLPGYWKSHFTGPAWLRTIAPPGLGFVGLGGWWGKLFADGGKQLILDRQLSVSNSFKREACDFWRQLGAG